MSSSPVPARSAAKSEENRAIRAVLRFTATFPTYRKVCTCCSVEKPRTAFTPHPQTVDGLNSWCRSCSNEATSAYRKTPEGRAGRNQYRGRHGRGESPEYLEAKNARARAKTAAAREARKGSKCDAHVDLWKLQPPKPKERLYPDDFPHLTRNRRKKMRRISRIQRATPPWASAEAIEAIYSEAKRLTALHGVQFDVDHVVPLRNPTVSGLHCESNLQVILRALNVVKGNRQWPDMP